MTLFEKLSSSDIDDVLDGLYELGASRPENIPPQLRQLLVQLLSHESSEIRFEAAAAVGIRLRRSEFYDLLFHRLAEQERNESVLRVLMDATTAIDMHENVARNELSRVLASNVLKIDLADETRGTAYLCLLKLWNKISPQEYAKSPSELSKMPWDRNFVDGLSMK